MEASQRKQLPRLGQIGYINSLPVTLPIERGLVKVAAEITLAPPAHLNALFAEGRLDLGAMSTFFYLKNRAMTLIPRLSIAGKGSAGGRSNGAVGSVLFFAKADFFAKAEVASAAVTVSVPRASATSTCLLQVLCHEQYGFLPNLVACDEPQLDDECDAALVIGDYALAVDEAWSSRYFRRDLGEWWKQITGLPMVFGLWAAQTSWSERHPLEYNAISDGLLNALHIGLGEALPEVIAEASRRTQLSAARLERYYLDELDFSFTDQHRVALDKYESLCLKCGLLPSRSSSRVESGHNH